MDAKASEPTPQKQSVRNSRRFRANRICSAISVHVKKRVEVENCEREFFHLRGIVRLARRGTSSRAPSHRRSAAGPPPAATRNRCAPTPCRAPSGGAAQRPPPSSFEVCPFSNSSACGRVRRLLAPRAREQRVRRIEHFDERQPQIALVDHVQRAAVVLRFVLASGPSIAAASASAPARGRSGP